MKKLIVLFFIVLSPVFLIGCSNTIQRNLKNTLISTIEKKRGNDEQVVVKLRLITTFKWDKFYVFTPYTPIEKIYNTIGFKWPRAVKSGINHRDDINLLVFIKDEKVIQYIEYPRSHGDFYKIEKKDGFSPEEAVFEVKEEYLGEPWLVLYEITS